MASQFGTWWQKSRLRSWWMKIKSGLGWLWQKIQRHPFTAMGILVLLMAFLAFALAVHWLGWDWTGFTGGYGKITIHTPAKDTELPPARTLWDWLQLLIIPLMLAIGGFWLNRLQKSREEKTTKQRYEQDQQIALDKQHEDLLQAYLDRISELLLKESLRTSPSEEVRNVARVRTITVLTQLDARRIGYVFTFLREAGLMSTTSNDSVVSLSDADLHSLNWSQADLNNANLSGAKLNNANLSGAKLNNANLSDAKLSHTKLSQANLSQANLIGADLSQANLIGADLSQADLSHTNLIGADLSQADLGQANLIKADLVKADLVKANLIKADLSHADLRGADLSDASLSDVNLSQAKLSQAKLSQANLSQANLVKANLSQANLSGADFSGAGLSDLFGDLIEASQWSANLSGADLFGADLSRAKVTEEQLKEAKSLKDATMPDGSKHP